MTDATQQGAAQASEGATDPSIWVRLRESTANLERQLRELRLVLAEVAPADQKPGLLQPLGFQETAKAAIQVRCWINARQLVSERKRPTSELRQLCWLAQQLSGLTYSEIGKLWGGRDHTSVIYGCRRAVTNLAAGVLEWEWSQLLKRLGRLDLLDLWHNFAEDQADG